MQVFVTIHNAGMKINVCVNLCKELIDKGVCNKGFIWNPSNCVNVINLVILVSI